MVQGVPWKLNSYSAGQKIPCFYGIQNLSIGSYPELNKSISHIHNLLLQFSKVF